MKNLKILIFNNPVCFSESLKHIPNSLRVLEYFNRGPNRYPIQPYPFKKKVFNPFMWEGFLTKASVTYLYFLSYIYKSGLMLMIYKHIFPFSFFFVAEVPEYESF